MTTPTPPIARPDVPVPVLEQELAARKELAAALEATREALLAGGHPEEAHAWLDADLDTAWPLPGIAHPKNAGSTS